MSHSVLPIPLSPIVGRRRELEELARWMQSSRLITLTGVGGSGKTRLAMEALARLSPSESTPAWVDLAPLADGGLLTDHLSKVLGVYGEGMSGATQALTLSLKTRSLWLVLDNCEHLVDACARLVEVLLRFCAPLRILATSREPFGLAGEKIWQVPPLSLPADNGRTDLAELLEKDAVQLFLDRAREANPAFKLTENNAAAVAAICRRLDGLPLALELAAARTRVLSAEQIAERLDDSFRLLTTGGRTSLPRQKTLRGVFDWSHDLLTDEQRVLLRRLAVFVGGFSLAAVEQVAVGAAQDGTIDEDNVLDALAALVDRSLVQLEPDSEPARYRLLEIVRQYAREKLAEAGEEVEYRLRHADYFLALCESWAPRLFLGTDDFALMATIDREHDNLRAVLDWGMATPGKVEYALRVGVGLHWYWYFRSQLLEGWRRLDSALTLARKAPAADALLQARAMVSLGVFAAIRGDTRNDCERLAEAVSILQPTGDEHELAYALAVQAAVECDHDPDKAWRAACQAQALLEDQPDSVLKVFVCYWRGVVALGRQDLQVARSSCTRGVEIAHTFRHSAAIAHTSFVVALADFGLGDLAGARHWLAESLKRHLVTGEGYGLSQILRLGGFLAVQENDPERAARLFGGAEQRREELSTVLPRSQQILFDQGLAALREKLGRREVAQLMAAGAALSLEELVRLALGESPAAPPGVQPFPVAAPVAAPAPPSVPSPVQLAESPEAAEPQVAEPPAAAAGALRVSALGKTVVEVSGTSQLEAHGSSRTRELLVFLLLQKEGATKEEVGVALWPEASASQVRNSFHVTLHRLRAVLGHAEAIRVVGHRYSVDPDFVGFFDVPLFEEGAKAALARFKKKKREGGDDPAELLSLIALYRGELLEGESAGEWHLARRDRLQQLFVELLEHAGSSLQKAGRFAEAAEIYARRIEIDDLDEEAYRQRMVCLEELGQLKEAQRLYRKLVSVLDKELGVEPEPASREIGERLLRAPRSSSPA